MADEDDQDQPQEPTEDSPPPEESPPAEDEPTEDQPGEAPTAEQLEEQLQQSEAKVIELTEALDAAMAARTEATGALALANDQIQDLAARELAAHRARILAQNSDLVPDLVSGSTVQDLEASVETARSAFQAVLNQARSAAAEHVPAGASGNAPPPTDSMTPLEKITHALNRNGR